MPTDPNQYGKPKPDVKMPPRAVPVEGNPATATPNHPEKSPEVRSDEDNRKNADSKISGQPV